jgi:glycosyltransferase involved in cell wall biosynthesis
MTTRILFVHNNFPAQFLHTARALARRPDVKLAAIGSQTARALPGVKLLKYSVSDADVAATHPFARRFDLECRRAEQVLYSGAALAAAGFAPDIVVGHPGWGEMLPLRAMFPQARLITYCELYYRIQGQDVGFDPEFPQSGIDSHVRIHLKNAATLIALDHCDEAIAPSQWQRSTYPPEYQSKIQVVPEGVDIDKVKPNPGAEFRLPSGQILRPEDEVVTYVTRAFEPLRGLHILMRALPQILAARPKAQVLIVGGAGAPYGQGPPRGTSWRTVFFDEIAGRVDARRIHFTGALRYDDYLRALQVSGAHVYLTYPFVLSWSLLEAMAAGCVVVASDTAPPREVIDGENGMLVPFFDRDKLAQSVIEALAHPRRFKAMRKLARATIAERFDSKRICLPKMLALLGIDPAEPERPEKPRRRAARVAAQQRA